MLASAGRRAFGGFRFILRRPPFQSPVTTQRMFTTKKDQVVGQAKKGKQEKQEKQEKLNMKQKKASQGKEKKEKSGSVKASKKLTVAELRAELEKRGMSTKGTKTELFARFQEVLSMDALKDVQSQKPKVADRETSSSQPKGPTLDLETLSNEFKARGQQIDKDDLEPTASLSFDPEKFRREDFLPKITTPGITLKKRTWEPPKNIKLPSYHVKTVAEVFKDNPRMKEFCLAQGMKEDDPIPEGEFGEDAIKALDEAFRNPQDIEVDDNVDEPIVPLPGPIVDVQWIGRFAGLRGRYYHFIDGSWYLPAEKQDAYKNFIEGRIPFSRYFDLDEHSDKMTKLPHMLPTPEYFEALMTSQGINDKDKIIIYDQKGCFSAPRVWWTFKVFGAENVAVCNGGLPAWQRSPGGFVEEGEGDYEWEQKSEFKAKFQRHMVVGLEEMRRLIDLPQGHPDKPQVLDARPAPRWSGKDPEPRPGLRCGHMPGSINIPFTVLLTENDPYYVDHPAEKFIRTVNYIPIEKEGDEKRIEAAIAAEKSLPKPKFLKHPIDLKHIFEKAGVDLSGKTPLITTCGSGVTAAIITLALHVLGHTNNRLYDGSFAEWGQNHLDTPVIQSK